VLSENNSSVNVKSIIAEEINHLAEMKHQLKEFSADWNNCVLQLLKWKKNYFANG